MLHFILFKKLGFDSVDFQLADTNAEPYTMTGEEAEACLLAEKAAMDAAGITVFQVHGPWRYPPQDFTEEERAERLEKMQRSIRFAALLGSKNWIVHPIMPYGTDASEKEHAAETWALNLDFMKKLLVTAKECDVTICLENMPFTEFSISTPEKILELAKTINDEHFQICLDTGHVSVFPGKSPADALRLMKDYVKTLHIHDNSGKGDEHKMPYSGIIDWDDFAAALKEIDFRGVISLECGPDRKLPDDAYEAMWKGFAQIAAAIGSKLYPDAK